MAVVTGKFQGSKNENFLKAMLSVARQTLFDMNKKICEKKIWKLFDKNLWEGEAGESGKF